MDIWFWSYSAVAPARATQRTIWFRTPGAKLMQDVMYSTRTQIKVANGNTPNAAQSYISNVRAFEAIQLQSLQVHSPKQLTPYEASLWRILDEIYTKSTSHRHPINTEHKQNTWHDSFSGRQIAMEKWWVYMPWGGGCDSRHDRSTSMLKTRVRFRFLVSFLSPAQSVIRCYCAWGDSSPLQRVLAAY